MNYVFTIVSCSFPKSGFSSFLLGKDCRMVIRTALFSPARETLKASVFFLGKSSDIAKADNASLHRKPVGNGFMIKTKAYTEILLKDCYILWPCA